MGQAGTCAQQLQVSCGNDCNHSACPGSTPEVEAYRGSAVPSLVPKLDSSADCKWSLPRDVQDALPAAIKSVMATSTRDDKLCAPSKLAGHREVCNYAEFAWPSIAKQSSLPPKSLKEECVWDTTHEFWSKTTSLKEELRGDGKAEEVHDTSTSPQNEYADEEAREAPLLVLKRRKAVAEFLVDNGFASVNAKRHTLTETTFALHVATQRGDEEMVRCLIEEGADANHKNSSGHTALQVAQMADKGGSHLQVIRSLASATTSTSREGHTVAVSSPAQRGGKHLQAWRRYGVKREA